MSSDSFHVSRDGDVATVTMATPTMTPAFFRDCERVFRELGDDAGLRAIVVRGSDKAFCYGLDLRAAFAEWGPTLSGGGLAKNRTELLGLIKQLQRALTAIADVPVPTIAAIHGWCIGGGIDLISACDLRICSADAKFSIRETRVAMVADIGTLQRLPRIIGKGHMRELAFTGKDVDARRAEKIGLVNDIYADRAALDEAATALAREIAAAPPLVVRGVKHVLDVCEDRTIEEGLDYVAVWNSAFLASEDLGEATAAFVQKRTPVFKGR